MKIGYNGAVASAGDVHISVFDHGFLYGMGLFETLRTYQGRPFLLEKHLARLAESCQRLHIRYTPDTERIAELIRGTAEANGLSKNVYVRLTVTAGEGGLGLPTDEYGEPHEILMVKALPEPAPGLYTSGRELRLLRTPRNTPELGLRMKSLHYMNSIAAKRELAESGASTGSEGLMLTAEGWLAEGVVSNLFFAVNGAVYTPSLDTGILPGITREHVLHLAREAGYPVHEGRYRWEQLLDADEVWTTNSIQELVPATQLMDTEGRTFQPKAGFSAGPIFRDLHEQYLSGTEGSGS